MARAKVAVLKTTPDSILKDYHHLLHLADYQRYLPKDGEIALKIKKANLRGWPHKNCPNIDYQIMKYKNS